MYELRTGINNLNYPFAHYFLYCLSHFVAFDCGMFMLIWTFYLLCLAWYVYCCDFSVVM